MRGPKELTSNLSIGLWVQNSAWNCNWELWLAWMYFRCVTGKFLVYDIQPHWNFSVFSVWMQWACILMIFHSRIIFEHLYMLIFPCRIFSDTFYMFNPTVNEVSKHYLTCRDKIPWNVTHTLHMHLIWCIQCVADHNYHHLLPEWVVTVSKPVSMVIVSLQHQYWRFDVNSFTML